MASATEKPPALLDTDMSRNREAILGADLTGNDALPSARVVKRAHRGVSTTYAHLAPILFVTGQNPTLKKSST